MIRHACTICDWDPRPAGATGSRPSAELQPMTRCERVSASRRLQRPVVALFPRRTRRTPRTARALDRSDRNFREVWKTIVPLSPMPFSSAFVNFRYPGTLPSVDDEHLDARGGSLPGAVRDDLEFLRDDTGRPTHNGQLADRGSGVGPGSSGRPSDLRDLRGGDEFTRGLRLRRSPGRYSHPQLPSATPFPTMPLHVRDESSISAPALAAVLGVARRQ